MDAWGRGLPTESGASLGGQPATAHGGTAGGTTEAQTRWFTSYARSGEGDDKRVAVAVVVEDGQGGDGQAAWIAKRIMQAAIG